MLLGSLDLSARGDERLRQPMTDRGATRFAQSLDGADVVHVEDREGAGQRRPAFRVVALAAMLREQTTLALHLRYRGIARTEGKREEDPTDHVEEVIVAEEKLRAARVLDECVPDGAETQVTKREGSRAARERALQTLARLGVLADEPDRRAKLLQRVELFLWHFLRARWYDAHRFFSSIEPVEAMELVQETFLPGRVLAFFSERQDELEWENCLTVGLALVFASMRKAAERGFDPRSAGTFTLQRMMEQALEDVDSLEDLLRVGAPP